MTLKVTNSSTPCCKISNLIRTPSILGPRCKGHDSELMDHLRMFRVNYSVIYNQLLLLGTIFFSREHLSSICCYLFEKNYVCGCLKWKHLSSINPLWIPGYSFCLLPTGHWGNSRPLWLLDNLQEVREHQISDSLLW